MKINHSRYRHGMTGTKLHEKWRWMVKRCHQESSSNYEIYGGRGIIVCDEWHTFENFMDWANANGYDESLTIDRIDPDGNYCPENCRWITFEENIGRSSTRDNYGRNKNIKLSNDDADMICLLRRQGMTLRQLAAMYDVSSDTIHYVSKGRV